MTYQIAFAGSDGMVIASDQKELLNAGPDQGGGYKPNMLTKIRIDESRRYAWAFAGKRMSVIAAGYFERELENNPADSGVSINQLLRDCCDRAWKDTATGPDNESTIILIDGPRKALWRAIVSPMTVLEPMKGGRCFAGQTFNAASFIPRRFYSPEMSIAELASVAAYTLREAHKADTVCVDGLDIAIYSDATGRFDFVPDPDMFWRHAETMHSEIFGLLKSRAIPLLRLEASNTISDTTEADHGLKKT